LCRADLTKANLTKVDLTGADLSGADLYRADLTGAYLIGTDLAGANLLAVNLTGAHLNGANLTKTDLTGALLPNADLTEADLTEANLTNANLTEALLSRAQLQGAELFGTHLMRTVLSGADLDTANFEPDVDSLSSVVSIESVQHLARLRFTSSPTALVLLRERFAKAGFRDQERQVTFAKLRSQEINAWRTGSFQQRAEAAFSYVAFDLTCRYGLTYGRPLRILGGMIPVFAVAYILALRSQGSGAIWRVWSPGRILQEEGQAEAERLSWATSKSPRRCDFLHRLCRALWLGLLFSLLSAFQIGWRNSDVNNWITRLQPREYTLRGTGWVRVVSGAQSLLSLYLFVLWALAYFGRPFE
jgi:hypothetical protein